MSFSASNSISLEVNDVFIQLGKVDIDMRCTVNCSVQLDFIRLQLLRSNESIVYLTPGNKMVWQDSELKDRTKTESKTLCSDNGVIYLYIKISRSKVYPLKDIGPYLCRLHTFSSDAATIAYDSKIIMLNITGNSDILSILFILLCSPWKYFRLLFRNVFKIERIKRLFLRKV